MGKELELGRGYLLTLSSWYRRGAHERPPVRVHRLRCILAKRHTWSWQVTPHWGAQSPPEVDREGRGGQWPVANGQQGGTCCPPQGGIMGVSTKPRGGVLRSGLAEPPRTGPWALGGHTSKPESTLPRALNSQLNLQAQKGYSLLSWSTEGKGQSRGVDSHVPSLSLSLPFHWPTGRPKGRLEMVSVVPG